jgi:hypothetical protein
MTSSPLNGLSVVRTPALGIQLMKGLRPIDDWALVNPINLNFLKENYERSIQRG